MGIGRNAKIWTSRLAVRGRQAWRSAASALNTFFKIGVATFSILVVLGIIAAVLHGMWDSRTRIEAISVPKSFADSGYTPDVASQRLRDALLDYTKKANSSMHSPAIALHGELKDIIVPKIELSLDSLISTVRNFFGIGSQRTISGEFVARRQLLWLRVRIDGKEVYRSEAGVDPDNPDELLAAAAPAILEEIQPYIVASHLYEADPERAVAKADAIIARGPERDDNVYYAHILRGNFFTDRGATAQAAASYSKAIAINRNFPVGHSNLSLTLKELGNLDAAIAEARTSLRMDQNWYLGYIALGLALLAQNNADEAIAQFRRATALEPKSFDAHAGLGYAFRDKQNFDAAIAEYREAIAIAPKDTIAHVNLGGLFIDSKRFNDAERVFRTVIELKPDLAEGHYGLGLALREQGDLDGAIAALRRGTELDPRRAAGHFELGVALRANENVDDAIGEFRVAVALDPGLVSASFEIANALLSQGIADEAIAELDRAVKLSPDALALRTTLSLALQTGGYPDKAIAELRDAAAANPTEADIHISLGAALRDQNRLAEAVAEFKRALEIDAKSIAALARLGETLREMNDPVGAMVQFQRARDIDPTNGYLHVSLGEVLREQGRIEEAGAAYDTALRFDPEIAGSLRDSGTNAFTLAQYMDAVSNLSRSVHLRPYDPYAVLWLYLARVRSGQQQAAAELAADAAQLQSTDWPAPVVDLYRGKATPQALDAPDNPDGRCELQFYVGEWLLLQGDTAATRDRLAQAVDICPKSSIERPAARAELKRLDRRSAATTR
jgi:tetratricopeptide (TPR) repeat protein